LIRRHVAHTLAFWQDRGALFRLRGLRWIDTRTLPAERILAFRLASRFLAIV
jgi:hypothetical protein